MTKRVAISYASPFSWDTVRGNYAYRVDSNGGVYEGRNPQSQVILLEGNHSKEGVYGAQQGGVRAALILLNATRKNTTLTRPIPGFNLDELFMLNEMEARLHRTRTKRRAA